MPKFAFSRLVLLQRKRPSRGKCLLQLGEKVSRLPPGKFGNGLEFCDLFLRYSEVSLDELQH